MRTEAEWSEMRERYRQGVSISQIAREEGLARITVRKYVQTDVPPAYVRSKAKESKLDPFKPFIRVRLSPPIASERRFRGNLKTDGALYVCRWWTWGRYAGKILFGGNDLAHRFKTNVNRAMVSHKDRYDSHTGGLFQEAIQNAADAKLDNVPWKEWRFVAKYDPAKRILILRDYGTTGMDHCPNCNWGELTDGSECTDQACKWGGFHNLSFATKESGKLGSRGEGKSLIILAGNETIIRTRSHKDHAKRMASRIFRDKDDWAWELVPNLAPDEKFPPGTEIEVRGIVGSDDVPRSVHEQLMNRGAVIADIQSRWYPLLKLGGLIRFGYTTDTNLRGIPGMGFPKVSINPDTGKESLLARDRLEVKIGGKVEGELRDLRVALAEQPMDETDPRIGIAFVKNGLQVITRISKFPRRIPSEIQAKLFGEVNVTCSKDKPFLELAENPDHRGYRANDPLFQKVRSLIEAEVDNFVKPYILLTKKRHLVSDKDKKRAQQALEVIQKALESVPQLRMFGGGEVPPPVEPIVRDQPYVSWIELDKPKYAQEERVNSRIIVMNPVKKEEAYFRTDVELRDASLQVLESETYDLILPAGSEDNPGRKEIEVTFDLPPSLEPGRHRIIAKLVEAEPGHPPVQVHALGKWLWIETEPPVIKRPRKPKTGGKDREHENTLRELWPVDDEEIPPETEMIFLDQDATMWFNLRGVRIAPFWGKVRPAGSEYPILYGLVAEQLIKSYADRRIAESSVETWTPEQVSSFGEDLFSLSEKFLRACITFHPVSGTPND